MSIQFVYSQRNSEMHRIRSIIGRFIVRVRSSNGHSFIIEFQNSRQHCRDARYLLLLMHNRIVRCVRFKVNGHTLADKCQQCQNVILLAMALQLGAQALHEPRAFGGVAPRIETRNGRIGDEKIGVYRNFVCHWFVLAAVRLGHCDATIQPIALTRLHKEQLWFAGQRGASICREMIPNRVQLIMGVTCVYEAQFAVRQNRYQNAVRFRMVGASNFLHLMLDLGEAQILVHRCVEVQRLQCVAQILTVHIGAGARLQRHDLEVLVIEDDGQAALIVVHIIFGCITMNGHAGYFGFARCMAITGIRPCIGHRGILFVAVVGHFSSQWMVWSKSRTNIFYNTVFFSNTNGFFFRFSVCSQCTLFGPLNGTNCCFFPPLAWILCVCAFF